MVGQRVTLKQTRIIRNGKNDRMGTIVGENTKKTSWWIMWDGRITRQRLNKTEVDIVSNVADILNDILAHFKKPTTMGETKHWTNSSQVSSTTYDEIEKSLTVRFKSGSGGVYKYADVSPETWADLKKSASIGTYMNKVIKPNYKWTKIS